MRGDTAGSHAADPNGKLEPRLAMHKPARTKLQRGQSREFVHVKFAEGAGVRARGGTLVSTSGHDLSDARGVLARHAAGVARLFAFDEQNLDADAARVARQSGRQQADLNSYVRLRLKAGADTEAALDALNALDVVETAYPEPLPVRQPTPSYTASQGYHSPASSSGIDANYAWTISGGTGGNVRIHDIEYSWNAAHEDLSKLQTSYYPNGSFRDPFNNDNHGTAVIGEMAGDANSYGVTGLTPHATIQVTNATNTERNYDLANSILVAAQNLRAGDVMLLEQQIAGPNGCGENQVGCVAVEYVPAYYDAIVSATSRGIIVIEPAGNGYQNLDSAAYGGVFSGARADSGAIVVGAGGAPGCSGARTRLGFSNYGARVDVQGWGECVTTTGYGDLQNTTHNASYTKAFGGTSSASPIVASAAASLSSIAKARGMLLTPRDVRARLKATGTAQVFGAGGNIGPLPNLRAAIAGLSTTTADTTAPTVAAPNHAPALGKTVGTTGIVPTTVTWSASDASGIAAYQLYVSTNGGAWTSVALASATARSATLNLTPGNRYVFTVRAKDGAGNWSGWKYGVAITPANLGDASNAMTYSSGWTRYSRTYATNGTMTSSPRAGARASVKFTGRAFGWVATKYAGAGKARLYLDGVLQGTWDLYSASTLPRRTVASWQGAYGTHTVTIEVLGTSGRPAVDVDSFVILR